MNGYEHYLFADQPDYHGGPNHYVPMATDDLADASSWEVIGEQMPASQFPQNSDGGRPRHGTIVPVTREQYEGVLEAYAPDLAVRSVEAIEVSTPAGTAPQLPATAHLVKADDSTEDAPVEWEDVPAERYAHPGTFTVAGTAQDDSRHPVEATVTVTAQQAALTATTRCTAGKNVLVTTVTNAGSETVTAEVATAYGTREITLDAGARASQSFTTRQAQLPAGEAALRLDGEETVAAYPAASCG